MTDLAKAIVKTATDYAALPAERDRRIIDLIVQDSASVVQEAASDPGRVVIDPDTGMLVNQDREAEREAQRIQQLYVMRESFSAGDNPLAPERQENDERRKTITRLAQFGAKPSAEIERVLKLYGALESLAVPPPVLDVSTIKPEDLSKAFNAYVDAKMRAATAQASRGELHSMVAREMTTVVRGSVDHYLAEPVIREAFSDAAESFMRVYPAVKGCKTLADAAAIDETGNGVVAWHTATRAVEAMDNVISMLLGVVAPPYMHFKDGGPEHRTSPAVYLALSAPMPEGGQMALRGTLGAHGCEVADRLRINGAPKPNVQGNIIWSPWKQYGAQLDAGVALSLPADAAELRKRADEF